MPPTKASFLAMLLLNTVFNPVGWISMLSMSNKTISQQIWPVEGLKLKLTLVDDSTLPGCCLSLFDASGVVTFRDFACTPGPSQWVLQTQVLW